MSHQNLAALLQTSTQKVLEEINSFNPEQLQNSHEGKWTAAMVVEHLVFIDKAVHAALNGKLVTSTRPPEEKLAIIKWAMEERGRKYEAPPIAMPTQGYATVAATADAFTQQRKMVLQSLEGKDVTLACTGVKHPAFGTLTISEWINFSIYHAERHRLQLHEMKTA